MKLSPKESAFCRAMLTEKDQTAAAIKAKYSPRSAAAQASRLLKKRNILAEIDRLRGQADDKAIIDRNRIIQEWNKIAFLNSRVCYDESDQMKRVADLPEDVTAAISEVMELQTEIGHSRKIKFHSKEQALKELSKLGGLYPEEGTGEAVKLVFQFGGGKNANGD